MAVSKTNIPAGLTLAESVLALLREAAEGTALWESSSIRTDAMHGPQGPLGSMVLTVDAPKEPWARFLSIHWEALDRKPGERASFFVAERAEPRSLEVSTTERLGYLAFLKKASKLLDGLPVALEEDTSWTWDHKTLTRMGRPTHRTVYRLVVSLNAKTPFKAGAWLKKSSSHVCASSDERADRCMFQLAQEAGLEHAVLSYEWTPKGVVLETASTSVAGKVQQKMFGDCKVNMTVSKKQQEAILLKVQLR